MLKVIIHKRTYVIGECGWKEKEK